MDSNLGVKSVISEAWKILKKDVKFFLILGLILFAGQFLLQLLANWLSDQGYSAMQLTFSLIQWGVQMYVGLIMLLVGIKAVRGESLTFDKILVQDFETIKNYLFVSIVYGLIIFGGVLLLIVPGIIWGLTYGLATYLAADKQLGVKEALSRSKQLTSGNRLKIAAIGLVLLVINILGAIPLGLGVIVTAPLSMLAGAVIYTRLADKNDSKPREQVAKPEIDNQQSQYQI